MCIARREPEGAWVDPPRIAASCPCSAASPAGVRPRSCATPASPRRSSRGSNRALAGQARAVVTIGAECSSARPLPICTPRESTARRTASVSAERTISQRRGRPAASRAPTARTWVCDSICRGAPRARAGAAGALLRHAVEGEPPRHVIGPARRRGASRERAGRVRACAQAHPRLRPRDSAGSPTIARQPSTCPAPGASPARDTVRGSIPARRRARRANASGDDRC